MSAVTVSVHMGSCSFAVEKVKAGLAGEQWAGEDFCFVWAASTKLVVSFWAETQISFEDKPLKANSLQKYSSLYEPQIPVLWVSGCHYVTCCMVGCSHVTGWVVGVPPCDRLGSEMPPYDRLGGKVLPCYVLCLTLAKEYCKQKQQLACHWSAHQTLLFPINKYCEKGLEFVDRTTICLPRFESKSCLLTGNTTFLTSWIWEWI